MTQLLVSVKNVQESFIALDAGVDIIDLKDPDNGALGALDLALSAEIVANIKQYNHRHSSTILTSATVGEHHLSFDTLIDSILQRALIHIDIIKVAVSTLEAIPNWQENFDMQKITNVNPSIKLAAVFFADQKIDLTQLQLLKKMGFYGAMLDTNNKDKSLIEICTLQTLQIFTQLCQKNALKSGLAGSLKPQHIEFLTGIDPFYIGFRGGVCESDVRNKTLVADKITKVRNLLQEHNKSTVRRVNPQV